MSRWFLEAELILRWFDGAPESPGKCQEEGQEAQAPQNSHWKPMPNLTLPGSPDLPPGHSLAS